METLMFFFCRACVAMFACAAAGTPRAGMCTRIHVFVYVILFVYVCVYSYLFTF